MAKFLENNVAQNYLRAMLETVNDLSSWRAVPSEHINPNNKDASLGLGYKKSILIPVRKSFIQASHNYKLYDNASKSYSGNLIAPELSMDYAGTFTRQTVTYISVYGTFEANTQSFYDDGIIFTGSPEVKPTILSKETSGEIATGIICVEPKARTSDQRNDSNWSIDNLKYTLEYCKSKDVAADARFMISGISNIVKNSFVLGTLAPVTINAAWKLMYEKSLKNMPYQIFNKDGKKITMSVNTLDFDEDVIVFGCENNQGTTLLYLIADFTKASQYTSFTEFLDYIYNNDIGKNENWQYFKFEDKDSIRDIISFFTNITQPWWGDIKYSVEANERRELQIDGKIYN